MIMWDRTVSTTGTRSRRRLPTSSPARSRSRPSCVATGVRPTCPAMNTPRIPPSWACACSANRASSPSLLRQNPLELHAQRGAEVVAGERVGGVGGEETDLRAAVETLAVEFEAVERLRLGELDHGVGELYFAPGATLLRRQDVENLRLQDVAAGDDEIGRRLGARRFLYHLRNLEQLALGLANADDAVHVNAVGRHFLHRNDIGITAEVLRRVDHLRKAAALVLDQHVGQQQGEWFTPDQFARAPDRVAEA